MVSVKLVLFCLVEVFFYKEYVECSRSSGRSFLAPYLNKRYELATSDDKFEDVMQALGVGFLKRKLGNLAKPVIELKENNGVYTFSSESAFKNTYINFKIGEEFEEETHDDETVKSIITQEKNKLIHVQKRDKPVTIIREFTPDKVTVVVRVGAIESVRTYTPL